MSVAERLAAVRQRIARACEAARRDAGAVTLVAVSKRHPVERVREAFDAGQLVFGENYVQELVQKAAQVAGARWHFIGHLQRNKVKMVLKARATVETVGSLRLLAELAKRAEEPQSLLLQVNVAGEDGKSGCSVRELPGLIAAAREAEKIELRGLMTIPPFDEDPRPHFAALRRLAEEHSLTELSMGMSADLETAIAEGATIVRVGTAIFGPRPE